MKEQNNFDAFARLRVLLAEDNEVNIFLVQTMLEDWGCEVTVAYNGKELLDTVLQHQFDIILTDIQMPVLSGLEAARQIRALSDNSKADIPIVALTASAFEGYKGEYREAGINDYVTKPVEEATLYKKIAALLQPNDKNALQQLSETPVDGSHTDAQPSPPLYDLTVLYKMSRGNEVFINRTKKLFIETIPDTVTELQEHSLKADWTGVSATAHKLKSTIDTMRIVSLKDVVRQIEAGAKSGDNLPLVRNNIQYLAKVVLQVVQQLKKEMNEQSVR